MGNTLLKSIVRSVCLLVGLACLNEAAQTADQQLQLWLATYEQTWATIRDKHFDKDLGGLDWAAVGEEAKEAVRKAKNEDEVRTAIGKMLSKLGHSHVGLIPREAFEQMSNGTKGGTLGMELRMVEGKAVVWRVRKGSPAEQAGVKPGWILETPKPLTGSDLRKVRVAQAMVEGKVGEEKALRFGEQGERKLTAVPMPGKLATFGNLPPIPVEMEFQRMGAVGYFRVSAFFEPEWLQTEMAQAMAQCQDCPGFVVDLRGNPGGMGILSSALLGWFLDKEAALGTLRMRTYELKLMANPRPEAFAGKLAVLVDGLSLSTSEFFAGAVKDLGRGRIFGERTGGMALPSAIEKLPNGDALQYTTANYHSAGGGPLEGRGVEPDQAVPLKRADLLAGRDAALDAALRWIRE
ncbi:MAG: S41 family peptidase [Bryobacter sp.]